MQTLRKAAKNLRVLIIPLVLITLFKTAICCLVYRRRKYPKILLEVHPKSKIKNEPLLFSLRRDLFVNALSDNTRHILNLPDYDLSDTESFVMSHGHNFGLVPRYLCKEEIFAEFESLWAQLLHHSASSVEQRTALKARLADLTHLYCDSTIDSRDFIMHKECFRAINRLRKNDNAL